MDSQKFKKSSLPVEETLVNLHVDELGILDFLLGAWRQRRDRQSSPLGGILRTTVAERAARSLALGSALVTPAAYNGRQRDRRRRRRRRRDRGCARHRESLEECGGGAAQRGGNRNERRHGHDSYRIPN